MKRKTTAKSEPNKKKYVVYKYTVVKFDEFDHGKLFECIPDIWFVNELRESCYFPPKTGKSYIQRAVNCEKPDDCWGVYECTVVKGGFLTYNAGFKLVQEKCSQLYNTSSAEEERQAADFRRQHPGLVGGNIEHVFSKPQSQTTAHELLTPNHDKTIKSVRNVNGTPTSNDDVMTSVGCKDTTEESVKTQKRKNKQTSCVKANAVINIETTTSTTSKNASVNLQSSSSICSKGPSRCGSVQSLNSRFDSSRSRSRSQQSTISPQSISPKLNHSRLNGKSSHANRVRASRSHSSVRSSCSRSSPRSEISSQSTRSKENHSRSNGKLSHKNGIRGSQSNSSVRSSRSRSISQRSSPCSEIPRQSTSPTLNHSRLNETISHKNGTLDSQSHSSVRPRRSRSNPRSEISRQSIIPKPNHSRSNGISSHTVRDSRSYSSVRLSRSRSNPHSEILRQSTCLKANQSRSNGKSAHTNRNRDCQSHSSMRFSRSRSLSQQSRQRSEISRQSTSPKPNHSRSKGKQSHMNGIRCEELRKSHQRSRRSSFRSSSEHSSIRSCHSRSKRKRSVNSRSHPPSSKASNIIRTANVSSTQERSNKPVQNCKQSSSGKHSRNFPTHEDPSRPAKNSECTSMTMAHLISSINELTEAVKKSNNQMTQNDRRMNRLEVTVNKIFITLGDMNGHNLTHDDDDLDADFEGPDLPIVSKTELYMVNRKLKDKEFRQRWINAEKHFCCPTKTSTDTRTISKYLKRFISLRVRSQLTLKEQGGDTEYTLYRDYARVYDFLIDVMKNGYAICKKKINRDEAHTALRVVWGRSKQLYNGEKKRIHVCKLSLIDDLTFHSYCLII